MKKVCLVLVTLVMLCGFFITTAEAGQMCWQVDFPTNPDLNGYVSVMASGGKWTRAIHGVWYVQGNVYLPMSGNMAKLPDGSRWYLQLNSTFITGSLGVLVYLDPSTLSGSGAYFATDSVEVTFTNISCKDLPAYVAP
jgi:hypothetical protein